MPATAPDPRTPQQIETHAWLDSIKAAYDSGDILRWVILMAEDEERVHAQFNMVNKAPNPFRKVQAEIERLCTELAAKS